MKRALFKHIIPNTAVGFLVMFIFSAVFNIFQGVEVAYYSKWLIMIAGYAFIYVIYCYGVGRLEFKNTMVLYVVEYLYWYVCLVGISILTGWMGFSATNLIIYAVCTLIAYIGLYWYYQIRMQIQAQEINELISRKNNE